MRAFHDSRNIKYRTPYGAIELGTAVELSLDLWDAPDAHVQLRTWIDGEGESLYAMTAGETADNGSQRYHATLEPQAAGVVWYQFIITEANGRTQRYGAREGQFGGPGAMRDWEPPSFKLTVFDDGARARAQEELEVELDRPFVDAVFGFLRGDVDARYLAETLETFRENYPIDLLKRRFGVFDGASCPDVMACLAGIRTQRDTTFTAEDIAALDPSLAGLAKGRLWCASLLQMLLPCEPAFPRPLKRSEDAENEPWPLWDYVDADCEAIIQNTLDLRRTLPLLRGDNCRCFAVNGDVAGIWHLGDNGTAACVLVNRSLQHAYDVPIPLVAEHVTEIISGYAVPIVESGEAGATAPSAGEADRYAMTHLYQLGSAILYFHPEPLLEKPMPAGLGVLAHITSLPADDAADPADAPAAAPRIAATAPKTDAVTASPESPESEDDAPAEEAVLPPLGTLGANAKAFVDWLADAGVRYWQVLPVNPTDEYGSPYAGVSAFAGNERLIDGGIAALADFKPTAEYLDFCWREADWLEPYAAFMALKERYGDAMLWQEWPEAYRQFTPNLTVDDPELDALTEKWRQLQFIFEKQWHDLRAYANERGVQIVGDMPIYVSADSADVWANPGIFQLEPDGMPALVAGCPPDAFTVEGQIWGNPVYNWNALQRTGYQWWMRRLERAFDLYDYVRLDHFIGFCRYFCIPEGEKATAGTYRPGPGLAFFRAAYEKFGPLPIIAEDLGMITPAVRALVAACGFPGMDIVQFVDGNDPLSGYQPRPGKIAYTGTHDNQTIVGYAEARYPERDAHEVADALIESVVTCDAPVAVLPLQDILGLDDDARMNTPGVAKGNWTWQAREADIADARERLHALVALASVRR
ncbi:MAG: 4-alpha-glucanotransferase [Coriobacteriaceae bacterium]|nr:4-alpha-glucanotransferase [Coriobacteriaceae bacterium]